MVPRTIAIIASSEIALRYVNELAGLRRLLDEANSPSRTSSAWGQFLTHRARRVGLASQAASDFVGEAMRHVCRSATAYAGEPFIAGECPSTINGAISDAP